MKAGKIEFRVDKGGNVHAPIGKVSFAVDALEHELHRVHGPDRPLEAGRGQGRLRPQRRDLEHDGTRRHRRHHSVPVTAHEENRARSSSSSSCERRSEGAKALYYTDFTGLNVKRMTELRRRLRKAGVEYVVIKNTLALRAVNESGLVGAAAEGTDGRRHRTRIRWRAAKVLTDFAKENDQKPGVKGGLLDGAAIDVAQVKQLASMPSREQMLAELGAGLQSPIGRLRRRAERPADTRSPVRSKR